MRVPSVVMYTVLRLLFFLVPLGLMLLFPAFRTYWWLAAVFAAVIGLSLSLIFLRRPRAEVSASLAARRRTRTVSDEDEEDGAAEDDPR